VTGTTSTLTLQVGGGGTGTAAFLSSSGDTATCRDTVQAGDTDDDGIAVQPDPITLTGSTIRDTRATDATLTFAGEPAGFGLLGRRELAHGRNRVGHRRRVREPDRPEQPRRCRTRHRPHALTTDAT
jgi:hypothetical protein